MVKEKHVCLVSAILFLVSCCLCQDDSETQPNIVFIMADDLGFADVGWNNPKMENVTKHISGLAKEGVILNQYYVQPRCSPSRYNSVHTNISETG